MMTSRRFFAAMPHSNRTVVALLLAVFIALSGCAEQLSPDAHVERGEQFYDEGELGSAVIEFKNALQADPGHAQARWGLALVGPVLFFSRVESACGCPAVMGSPSAWQSRRYR